MFTRPTVFVLGAGAVVDLNFPLGFDLRGRIVEAADAIMSDDTRRISDWPALRQGIVRYVEGHGGEMAIANKSCAKLRQLLPRSSSIDDFLHSRRDVREMQMVGKSLIAYCILKAEQDSYLKRAIKDGALTISDNIAKSFYYDLFSRLVRGYNVTDLEAALDSERNNLSIITFNYDRSIEESFARLAADFFEVDLPTARRAVDKMRIHHVYGQAGSVYLNQGYGDVHAMLRTREQSTFASVVDSMKTYNEAVSDLVAQGCRTDIAAAKRIYMVGCYPHRQNLELLFSEPFRKPVKIAMTATNLSEENVHGLSAYFASRGVGHELLINAKWKAGDILQNTEVPMLLL